MRLRDLYSDALQLSVLPPRGTCVACKQKCIFSIGDYDMRLAELRHFRGKVFLTDGAITEEHLDETGGYHTHFDNQAWHIYLTQKDIGMCACYTLMSHRKGVELEELRAHELLSRMEVKTRRIYELAIKSLMDDANIRNIGFGELAAWAIHEGIRNRLASMMMAVAAWPIYQMLGDALVLGAPTFRHRTSNIEKRLGGFALTSGKASLGSFYDACHKCNMEFVWFDSQKPLEKFAAIISELRIFLEKLMTCACRAADGKRTWENRNGS
jgi:hypothetical protein